MDLQLFARVVARFKFVIAAGFLIAVALALFTVAKVDLKHGIPHLAKRAQPVYASNATVLITQPGFPWGSAVQVYQQSGSGSGQTPVPSGDLGRLTTLTSLYAQLANSDEIARLVVAKAPGHGTISATQNYAISPSYYSTAMPILTITGMGMTPAFARATAQTGVDVLTGYLKEQQQAAKISDQQRVVVQELQRPRKTVVVNGTKKTLPIAVFLTVMLAVIGFVFVLENLRPRWPAAVATHDGDPVVEGARRTA